MQNVIKVEKLAKKYGDLTVFENVDLVVPEKQILMMVGGSGCGKSTLLRQIIGLEKPSEGKVYITGENITDATGDEKLNILRKFGVMFQTGGLFASMTIGENIKLILDSYTNLSDETKDEIVAIKLNSVGLNGFQDYLPSEISGGMRKRAAIARAMSLDPKILFFDEPGSGLDPVTAASIDQLIKNINNSLNTTIVIITHDLNSVMNIGDRVIMMDASIKGILADGKPEDLKKSDNEIVYNFFNRIGKSV